MNEDALAANLTNWESRVPVHAAVAGLERYTDDPEYVSGVARQDAP